MVALPATAAKPFFLKSLIGSLLHLVGSRALVVAEVLRAMTKRSPVSPAPGPLEDQAKALIISLALVPNVMVSGAIWRVRCCPLSATRRSPLWSTPNPSRGHSARRRISLQWFLSESGWDPEQIYRRRIGITPVRWTSSPLGRCALFHSNLLVFYRAEIPQR